MRGLVGALSKRQKQESKSSRSGPALASISAFADPRPVSPESCGMLRVLLRNPRDRPHSAARKPGVPAALLEAVARVVHLRRSGVKGRQGKTGDGGAEKRPRRGRDSHCWARLAAAEARTWRPEAGGPEHKDTHSPSCVFSFSRDVCVCALRFFCFLQKRRC